jgi:hypothetical protein
MHLLCLRLSRQNTEQLVLIGLTSNATKTSMLTQGGLCVTAWANHPLSL